jgi:hypothetical protein
MGPGYHNIDAMRNSHVGDDNMSGIWVPGDMEVTLYADPNYTGTSVKISGPARHCENDFIGKKFPDNSVSSMHVTRKPKNHVSTIGSWYPASDSN